MNKFKRKLMIFFLLVGGAIFLACKNDSDSDNPASATDSSETEKSGSDNEKSESVNAKSGVMLQGFTWDSAPRGDSSKWGKWYSIVKKNATAIANTFTFMWCPPPSNCNSESSEGYGPRELNDLNNYYGTKSELEAMISAIGPTKAIADIVINHRAGSTCWGDFSNPDWGVVKGSNYQAICSDDEGFVGYYDSENKLQPGDEHMTSVSSEMRGAEDTGEGYSSYRDIDHTNPVVQQGIIDWMNNVLKPAGFVGWRYDYVKGYAPYYVGLYDKESAAEFSVGELWPTDVYNSSDPSSWGKQLKKWISDTSEGGYTSKAFDFTLKGAMNTVFGYSSSDGSTTSGKFDYSLLADNSNLYISVPEYSVTFVDNHDTGSTQGHWKLSDDYVGTAYALILTHPGYPCVAWHHYFTYADSGSGGTDNGEQYMASNNVAGTSNTLRQHIDKLIQIRTDAGIEADSKRTTLSATSSVYAAKIEGSKKNLVVAIGGSYTPPEEGYGRIYKGTNFVIWEEGAEDAYSDTRTLSVTVESWVWNYDAAVFAWVESGNSAGQWIPVTGSGTTAYLDVPSDTTSFYMVRCVAGTTTPDLNKTGDDTGRVYNKTNVIEVTSDTDSYASTWSDYSPS
ncbi:MAG: hypothetical protein J6I53_10625 [Treponema sp.]|nr:hypothetical protein [Treponema sp.]